MMFCMQRQWHLKYSTLPCQKRWKKSEWQSKSFGGVQVLHCGEGSRTKCLWVVTLSIWVTLKQGRIHFSLLLNTYLRSVKMQTTTASVRNAGAQRPQQAGCAAVWLDHRTTSNTQNNANGGWCNQATIRWVSENPHTDAQPSHSQLHCSSKGSTTSHFTEWNTPSHPVR